MEKIKKKKVKRKTIILRVLVVLAMFAGLIYFVLEKVSYCWRWRAGRYEKYVDAASRYHKIPRELIRGVIWQESRYRPWVRGKHEEIGLMQITPVAVMEWEQRTNPVRGLRSEELFDPWTNIYVGSWYLAWCWGHWEGYASQWELTLAEYNAGYGVVEKNWLPKEKGEKLRMEMIGYPGTRGYVENVMKFVGK